MSDNPLSSKIIFDTTDFKAGMAELNRQIRVMESGFKATAAGMEDWENNSAGLEARIKSLGGVISLQKQKVEGLQGVYNKLAAEGKTSGKELQELQIKINKETESLNKMQGELNQASTALDKLGDEAKGAGKGMGNLANEEDRAEKNAQRLKSVMSGLGSVIKTGGKAILGLAAGAAAAAGALGGMVVKAADAAGELVDLSNQTGIELERLQELRFIGDQVGVSIETMAGSQDKLKKSMAAARDGNKGQIEDFEKLGIVVTNADGSLRDSKVVWQETLTALSGVANETERDVLAMSLLGKSATDLNPLIKTSAEEMQSLTNKAYELGAVMKKEDVESLEAFGDTLAGLKAGLKGTVGTLATAFLPAFQGLAGGAEKYLGKFSEIVSGSNGDLGKMAEGIGGLLGEIVSNIATAAPKMIQAGLGIIQGIVNAIVQNLPAILPAAISIITNLVQFIVDNLPMLIDAAMQILLTLAKSLISMLPMILKAALQIVLTLAAGIGAALPTLIPAIVDIMLQMVMVLVQNLPMLINAALQLILALAQGLIAALPMLANQIPTIMLELVNGLINNLPMMLLAAVEIILALAFGIIENIPLLLSMTPKLINALVTQFKSPEFKAKMSEMGKQLVQGLKDGWTNAWTNFMNNIVTNFMDMVAIIKKLLGIASPSKVFAGIGGNMALGMGKGFTNSFSGIRDEINQMINGMGSMNITGGMIPALSGTGNYRLQQAYGQAAGGGQVNSSSESYQFFAPVILQGPAGLSMGKMIKSKRY